MLPINLHELQVGDVVDGLVYISSHNQKTDFTSRAPVYGEITYVGRSVKFKIWDNYLQREFSSSDFAGRIALIRGKVDSYKDNLELVVETLNFNHGFEDKSVFYKSVDRDKVFKEFTDFVSLHLSQPAKDLLSHIFTQEDLWEKFKNTWAGSKMHDAQVGGLMNHTLKMLKIAEVLFSNDPRLKGYEDLLYLNIILHDIGKVYEIGEGGVYTNTSFVTHRTLGVEITTRYKEEVLKHFDEKFFYQILAVQQGHHGEYGDKPTTIWALIVHLIDMLECKVTYFLDRVEGGDIQEKNGHSTVYADSRNLII